MVWSLYERTEDEQDSSGANLFSYSGKKLEPLTFSNGKTQEDVVNETLDLINKGNKIIFIKGVCGTGKSAIALNIAKNFKKSSIVVPIKSLQEQYEKDYTIKKFVTKDSGNPLKISVIKGRNNFPCNFAGGKADNSELPCIIELKEKNTQKVLNYLEQNPLTAKEDFSSVSDVTRMNVAAACPYWAPIMPADINPKMIKDYKKIKYQAVSGKEFAIFQRKRGCPYYDQYTSYADSDVLIFNSTKYLIENTIGRKPKTDIDIIDECDEFLDNFANEQKINLNRLHSALSNLTSPDQETRTKIKELITEVNKILFDPQEIDIQKIKYSNLVSLFDKVLENPNLADEEEINYYNSVVETFRSFESVLNETYISINKVEKDAGQKDLFNNFSSKEDQVFVTLVSINLAEKFKELQESCNVLILMSGTLHSDEVLKDIFGLENFKVIEAETKNPGLVDVQRTGLERNCSYANFNSKTIDRKTYLKIMDVCLANAQQPTLIHVSAFKDLPTSEENEIYKFENLITQEKLSTLQSLGNSAIEDFSNGREKTLFTTRCSRGVDFAGNKCNSVIITRYPYPNINGLFWKILKKEQPDKFMEFYVDKARRELIQKVARGVRFKGDKVELWSPDIRVINEKYD